MLCPVDGTKRLYWLMSTTSLRHEDNTGYQLTTYIEAQLPKLNR